MNCSECGSEIMFVRQTTYCPVCSERREFAEDAEYLRDSIGAAFDDPEDLAA